MENQFSSSWELLREKVFLWIDKAIYNFPNIVIAILVCIIFYWLSNTANTIINKSLKRHIKQLSIRSLIARLGSLLILFLGLALALSVLNLDGTLKTLLAGAGVTGVALSLALQGTLSNTLSGFYLAVNDILDIGDWVETNGFSGAIVEINLRNTKLKEADNNIVVIPNKEIIEKPFKNFGLTKRVRTTINCGVAYDSNLEEVEKIATNAISDIFPPSEDEEVELYFSEFGDSSINFILRFWANATENLTALQVKSKAIKTLTQSFDAHNIEIPFPITTIVQR
ncbi:mechanosensitive ion channel [Flavobacteriaceae bacterium R38]|nr:mechanosensitive ion channel [Flavobacteriaceae bacterium R38]